MGPRPKSLQEIVKVWIKRCAVVGECWLWPANSLNGVGYGQLAVKRLGARKKYLAHRLIYRLFVGPIPQGQQVMHSCDRKRCVNPKHLSTGTQLDNEAGKVSRGRSSRGEGRWCATLTNKQAQQLLDLYRDGKSIRKLATDFGVTYWIAYAICKRLRWKYLK